MQEVANILAATLTLIEREGTWTPYPLGVYDAKGEWCSVAQEDTAQYSTMAALERALVGLPFSVAPDAYRIAKNAVEPVIMALAETILRQLESVQLKDHWKGYARGSGRSEYLLYEDLVVNFGSLAGHEGVKSLIRETLTRLRNESFKTFEMSIGDREPQQHRIGDAQCNVGHCGGEYPGFRQYPVKCRCGGLIHLIIDPSIYDFDWHCVCDTCGEDTEAFPPPALVVSNP